MPLRRTVIVVALTIIVTAIIGLVALRRMTGSDETTIHFETIDPSAKSLIVFYSGDGGWRSFDKRLTQGILQEVPAHTYSIIGVDTLKYFTVTHEPKAVAADLEELIKTKSDSRQKIILLGFSFGADVLPETYNNLSPEIKNRVRMVGLLSPGPYAQFQISLSDVLIKTSNAVSGLHPTTPQVQKIDQHLLVCVFGDKGLVDTICPDPWFVGAELIGLPGNHHFDKDYRTLATRLEKSMENHLSSN